MFITRIVIIALFLTLGACASKPSYVPAAGPGEHGHSSRKIGDDRYRVNFNGSRRTSYEEARDYALLRAAELTLAEGYAWFQVVDRETATTESREPRTSFGYERGYVVERNCGLLSCSSTVHPATYSRLGFDSHRRETRHSHSLEIVMGKGEMPEDGHYYDAKEVVRTMYGMS